MRSLILIDIKIDKDEALALLEDFSEFFRSHTGIEHEYWVERRDFSIVPTMVEADGDLKPTHKYRTDLNNEVHSRYGDFGTDNVIMWVHEDNFLYKGIWGQNWSGFYNKHSFQLCRWDKDNDANTFGTFYHELMHSFDWVVKSELKIDVNKLFGYDWDAGAVHGAGDWDYIGRRTGRENVKALMQIAPHLRQAYKSRKEKHFAPVRAAQWKLINALSTWLADFLKKK
jgi:hypothetical protein